VLTQSSGVGTAHIVAPAAFLTTKLSFISRFYCTYNNMSKWCDGCWKLFQNWDRLARLKYKGTLYASTNAMDLERNASIGCSLCRVMIGSTPQTVRETWKANRPLQGFRLSVDLSGIKRDGYQLYILRLDYGDGSIEIYVIPVLGLFKFKHQAISNR
jgi:hypothetical protein